MTPARKPTGSRSGASKAKRTAKKTTPKRTVAKKTTARKSAPRKTTAKKTTAKKAAPKKSVAKKAPAKTARATNAAVPVKKKTAAGRPFVRPNFAAPPKRKTRPAKLDAAQLKKIKANLTTKRTELEQRMAELEEDSFDSTQSDITGEVGLDEDFADAGTATFERERDLSIRNNIRDLIDQMTRAIDRIDQGTYGTCERCGQPIDAARLRELPHASLCLDCKRREERAR